ncbi:MAG: HK97 family phage prohead protease [Rhodoglobus sp.]
MATATKPPPAKAPGSADGSFEDVHARAVDGKFTAGSDANRGQQQGTDRRAAENLLRDNGYWRSDMTYQQALDRAKANLDTSSDGDTLSALRAEAASIYVPDKKKKKRKKKNPNDIRKGGSARSTPRNPWHPPASTPLAAGAGRAGKPWPPQWGTEPPTAAPGGRSRVQGFNDGSALYEGGLVYDPTAGKFRRTSTKPGASTPNLAPAGGPGGSSVLARYTDGSAVYENGIVWDPAAGVFRKPPAPKPPAKPAKSHPGLLESKGVEQPMDHKALPINDFKVLDAGEGIVECIVSVTGIKDNVDDVIMPGAYEKTLQARTPKGVYSHDWDKPIAKTLSVRELLPGHKDLPAQFRGKPWPAEAGALMVKAQFNLKTERGRDAYEDVKFYADEQEWSVGYNVPTGGSKTTNGVRYIKTMDLFEFSPVLFGAMPLSGTLSVKSAQQAWIAVKDIVGGMEGMPAKVEHLTDKSGPFDVCSKHGDQPGEIRAKCMAMKACALNDHADMAKPMEEKKSLISEDEMTEMAALRACLFTT